MPIIAKNIRIVEAEPVPEKEPSRSIKGLLELRKQAEEQAAAEAAAKKVREAALLRTQKQPEDKKDKKSKSAYLQDMVTFDDL